MTDAKRKISIQLLEPLAKRLNDLTARACLNRDAYLDVILRAQATALVSDAAGHRNSEVAKTFLKRNFADLRNFKLTSISLTASTAQAIDDACSQVNTLRDVFVNRVILMLVGKADVVARLLDIASPYQIELVRDAISQDAPGLYIEPRLAAIADFVHEDPFTSLRLALESEYPETKGRLYSVVIGNPLNANVKKRGFAGLNPLIEDELVPESAAAKENQSMMDELLEGPSSNERGE